jgi:molybdopterin molybdotransferase
MATGNSTSSSARSTSTAEHLGRILAAVQPVPPRALALAECLGRVLAADAVAQIDVPGFDNSAMDGYALRRVDALDAGPTTPVTLDVVGDLPAGSGADPRIAPGQAVRIMTGAPMPADADCVVPVEATDGGTTTVEIRQAPAPEAHIRRRGTDVEAGVVVLTAGRALDSRDIAAAAAVGLGTLLVHPAPRVGVISTGSELRSPGEPLERGQIHDSNSFLLAAAVTEAGGIPVRIGIVADDDAAFAAALETLASEVDAVVTSGGVSVGAYDVVKAVLEPLGIWFGPVRMQPGKPQGFGLLAAGKPIFTLPGNPVSVFVSFEAFVRPALLAMQGRRDIRRPTVKAEISDGWRSPTGREQHMPALLEFHPGAMPTVRPASRGGAGSYLVAGLAGADAVAIIPEDTTEVRAGDTVTVIPLRPARMDTP